MLLLNSLQIWDDLIPKSHQNRHFREYCHMTSTYILFFNELIRSFVFYFYHHICGNLFMAAMYISLINYRNINLYVHKKLEP